eukprot:3225665-Amphidinium_carterae.1
MRLSGRRKFTKQFVPWGSKVLYAAGTRKDKQALGLKWLQGIFVGFAGGTTDYIVTTVDGCVRSNDVKRLEPSDASDGVLFNAVVGSHWRMVPQVAGSSVPEELPTKVAIRVEEA